jgi:hypothetical protein
MRTPRTVGVCLALALAAVAVGAMDGGTARAACASTLTWRATTYTGWATRSPATLGERLGRGVVPACRDAIVIRPSGPDGGRPVRPRLVALRAIAGVDPAVAVAVDGDPRTAYLAPGYFPQLPGHPLHAAIYGSADRPLETLGRRCTSVAAFAGRALGSDPGALVARSPNGRRTTVLLDVRTRVRGPGRRGLPHVAAGERVRITAVRCGADLVAREVAAAP